MTQQDAHTVLNHLINAGIITWIIGLALYIVRTRLHNQKVSNHARSTIRPNRRPIKTHTVTDLTEEIAVNPPHAPGTPQPAAAREGIVFPEV